MVNSGSRPHFCCFLTKSKHLYRTSFSEATFRQYLLKYLQTAWLIGLVGQNEMNS